MSERTALDDIMTGFRIEEETPVLRELAEAELAELRAAAAERDELFEKLRVSETNGERWMDAYRGAECERDALLRENRSLTQIVESDGDECGTARLRRFKCQSKVEKAREESDRLRKRVAELEAHEGASHIMVHKQMWTQLKEERADLRKRVAELEWEREGLGSRLGAVEVFSSDDGAPVFIDGEHVGDVEHVSFCEWGEKGAAGSGTENGPLAAAIMMAARHMGYDHGKDEADAEKWRQAQAVWAKCLRMNVPLAQAYTATGHEVERLTGDDNA